MALSDADINAMCQRWLDSPEGQRRTKAYVKQLRETKGTTANGSHVLSLEQMEDAAANLVHTVYTICHDLVHAGKMPQSVADILLDAEYSHPIDLGDGHYAVYIYFPNVARESLEQDYKDYGGIDNILALFNNGAHARNYVFGWWNGHAPTTGDTRMSSGYGATDAWVRSKKDREPLQFMQQAKSDFDHNYGVDYGNPEIILDPVYFE